MTSSFSQKTKYLQRTIPDFPPPFSRAKLVPLNSPDVSPASRRTKNKKRRSRQAFGSLLSYHKPSLVDQRDGKRVIATIGQKKLARFLRACSPSLRLPRRRLPTWSNRAHQTTTSLLACCELGQRREIVREKPKKNLVQLSNPAEQF